MPHLPYPSDDEIAPEARAIQDEFVANYGRPSHIFRVLSWNHRFLKTAADSTRRRVVESSKLDRWVKEAVIVITCSTQQTQYCIDGHSHTLQRQGLSDEQVRAIQNRTFEGFSDPELSIFRFAHKAADDPKTLTKEDYASLTDLGLTYETILEILAGVWGNTAMNMIVDALAVTRTPEMETELKS
jgi:AhpD family alkylhydroperoxidase